MNPNSPEAIRKKYPERLTRGKAIKLYCKINCCAGDEKSWRDCKIKHCFLWAFRKGIEETPEKAKIISQNDGCTPFIEDFNAIEEEADTLA